MHLGRAHFGIAGQDATLKAGPLQLAGTFDAHLDGAGRLAEKVFASLSHSARGIDGLL